MKKIFSFLSFVAAFATIAAVQGWLGADSVYSIAPMGALGSIACRSLQASLLDFFGRNIALYRTGGSTGFLKWLLSPQNTARFRKISNDIQGVPGKKKGVAFRVDLPYCFQLAALNVTCTANNIQYIDPTSGEMVFDLTNPPFRHVNGSNQPVRLRFKEEDLMKYCTETDQSYITNKIAQYLLEWEENFDKVLAVAIGTHVGTNAAAAAITNVPIFVAGTNTTPNQTVLNADAVWYLDQLFADMGLPGQYAIIGGTIVNKLAFAQKIAAANAVGFDLSKVDLDQNQIPFYDRNFNTPYGASDALLLAPGTVQLVTWNKYKGEHARGVTNLYSKGTITLPRTGLEIDWKWWYDYNCEEWIFEGFLYAELAAVPPGGCGVSNAGVNGIIRIHDCGVTPLVPECPAEE